MTSLPPYLEVLFKSLVVVIILDLVIFRFNKFLIVGPPPIILGLSFTINRVTFSFHLNLSLLGILKS